MPLYECSKCHAVDNTALNPNYWYDVHGLKLPALCTECDTQVGKWHDKFPKLTAEEYRKKYPESPIEFPVKDGSNA